MIAQIAAKKVHPMRKHKPILVLVGRLRFQNVAIGTIPRTMSVAAVYAVTLN